MIHADEHVDEQDHEPADDEVLRCRRGRACDRRDARGRGTPVDLPGLCDRDRQLLVAALRDLPVLYAQLGDVELALPQARGLATGRIRSAYGGRLPLSLQPSTLADAIADELHRWEEVLRDRLGMPALDQRPRSRLLPDRTTAQPGPLVQRAATLLREQVTALMALAPTDMLRWTPTGDRTVLHVEDGADAVDRIITLAALAHAVIGETVHTRHLKGSPCPGCGHATLQLTDGAGQVVCSTCRDEWEPADYDLIAALAHGEPAPQELAWSSTSRAEHRTAGGPG